LSRLPRRRVSLSISVHDPTRGRCPRRGLGDQLREEILDATIELLLQTGQAKAVSIRSVAQRVGVTSPSIYLHFAEKDALLDAVCARYFEKLDAEMQRAAVGEQLVASGAASLPPSGSWGYLHHHRAARTLDRVIPRDACKRRGPVRPHGIRSGLLTDAVRCPRRSDGSR
jgi:AcrR family transcriptional regulator